MYNKNMELIEHINKKYNIIKNQILSLNDINDDIKNFIKYYFEDNKYIILPDYFNILLNHHKKNNLINIDNIKILILNYNVIYLKKKNEEIINEIKINIYNINKLNIFIEYYIEYIKNIFYIILNDKEHLKIKNCLLMFDKYILSNSNLHIFLQNKFYDKENYNNIKILFTNIKKINTNYQWFLKLIGNYIQNNIIKINFPIPKKYNKMIKFNYLIDIFNENIINFYYFSNNELIDIMISIIDKIKLILNELFKECLIIEMIEIFKKLYNFNNIIKDINIIKNSISNYISYYIKNISKLNENDINYLIILICNNSYIIDTYVFDSLNNDIILNVIINSRDNNIFKLIKFIEDKTIFFDIYYKKLIKRLLSNQLDLNQEEILCNELIKLGYIKKTHKIYKIINDVIKSKLTLREYNLKVNKIINKNITPELQLELKIFNNIKLDLIITSYGNWNINYNNGYVLKLDQNNSKIMKFLFLYSLYYEDLNVNKKIMWLFQYGHVEILFEQDINKIVVITLLPIQLLVLELFDIFENINIEDIMKKEFFDNYSKEFKFDIINSMIISNIITINNNILSLNKFGNINTDLINIYKNNSISNKIIKINENALTKENVISCWINHLIKIKSENFKNLLILLNNNINKFNVSDIELSEILKNMIEKDYIKFDENTNEYIKIYY